MYSTRIIKRPKRQNKIITFTAMYITSNYGLMLLIPYRETETKLVFVRMCTYIVA